VRLFCEIFLVVVLIWLGWSKSFQDRVNHIRGVEPTPAPQAAHTAAATAPAPAAAPAPRQPFIPRYAPARPASTPSGDWMWDPAHRNPLDRPAYKTGTTSQPSEPANANYWIDSRGVRHPVSGTPSP
jgi:hypothetical protein